MDEFNNFNEQGNNVVTGVEPAKKGKGGLIAGITAGVVLVGAGGGAIAYATSDYVKNQVKLMTSSPESYYAWVNEKNTDEFAKMMSEQYQKSIDALKGGQTAELAVRLEPNNDAKNYLIEDLDEEDEQEIIDIISNIDDVTLGIKIGCNSSKFRGNIFADMNGSNITSIDIATDTKAFDAFLRCTDLSEQWININFADTYDSYIYSDDEKKMVEAFQKYSEDPASVLSPQELETEITKYMNLWTECISDVELQKKEAVEINDITVEYTVTTVTIDTEKAEEITRKFVDTAREDEIIKGVVIDKLGLVTLEDYNKDLDDILEEFETNRYGTLELSTYIDPTGCIRGMYAEVTNSDNEVGKLKCVCGKDGDQVRAEVCSIDSDGEYLGRMLLNATENGNSYTGKITYDESGDKYTMEFTDLEIVADEKCSLNGLVTIIMPEDEDYPPVSVRFNSDGATQEIAVPIDIDGKNYGKVVLCVSYEAGADVSVPDKAGAYIIDSETSFDIKKYATREQIENCLTNLFKKIGLSDEYTKETVEYIIEDIYWEPSYDDDGFIEDDYDWEDFDLDFDDFDDLDIEEDVFEADMVIPTSREAYICVADLDFKATYGVDDEDTLGYNAKVAEIKGDGTYTVKVSADTDGYRNRKGDEKPYGLRILGIEVDDIDCEDDARINVTSVKIDGKEYPVTESGDSEYDDGSLFASIFLNFGGDLSDYGDMNNMIDAANLGEWTELEVTFDVVGVK